MLFSTYAGLLTEKYGIPVNIELDNNSADIPEEERLSLNQILPECIIIASARSLGFLHVYLEKGKNRTCSLNTIPH